MAGTVVCNVINTDTGLFSTNNAYSGIAKAWVNFNGASGASPVIRASFNVSSVTRNGTGDYTINFATALTDTNYVPLAMGGQQASGGDFIMAGRNGDNPVQTTSAYRLYGLNRAANNVADLPYGYFAVLGN